MLGYNRGKASLGFNLFESPFKQEFDVKKGIYYDAHMKEPIPDSGHGLFCEPVLF